MDDLSEFIIIGEDDYHQFFSKSTLVIPASDRKFKIPEALKRSCVLFSDGDVIIDKNSRGSMALKSYLTACIRRGFNVNKVYLADMSLIRKLYETNIDADRVRLVDEQPMEKIASSLLKEACSARASDIHIKINGYEAGIFFRINGDMHKIREVESEIAHSLVSALYNAADNADATYKLYSYQSARITNGGRLVMPAELQSLRLQFNPLSSGGRYMIARLLYADKNQAQKTDLTKIGFHSSQKEIIHQLMMEPEGVNMIAGPTGSGKSTTLKIILENIYIEKERKINIISIEDPPEYQIDGTSQLPVSNVDTEDERGAAYSKAIVSALRSDPDIIMPGEARDSAVINLVFTAAMTGHQVWTSIHANSAISVINRLRDQGVEKYKLTDPKLLTGIVSQRLVKTLCNHCKIPFESFKKESRYGISMEYILNELDCITDRIFLNNENGCECCSEGYSGRTVVAEVIKTDFKILELIYLNEIESAYEYWIKKLNGMSINEHGWLKVAAGIVDPFDAKLKLGGGLISEERRSQLLLM